MKFHFDPNQEYQKQAMKAIIDNLNYNQRP
ncbi:hypothetical protein BMS3Abin15_01030 [bacterium BMS3Abin15]|nr:hypothetical protein BMS3Abin15_01030 [bacterium BMS3Abin15]